MKKIVLDTNAFSAFFAGQKRTRSGKSIVIILVIPIVRDDPPDPPPAVRDLK